MNSGISTTKILPLTHRCHLSSFPIHILSECRETSLLEPFCEISSLCVCVCVCVCALRHFSCVQLFATPWTITHQAPLSLGFPRQKYWSGLPFPSPGDLLDWGIKPVSPVAPALQAESHGRHLLMWNNTNVENPVCFAAFLCFPNKPHVIFSLWIC